MFLCPNYPLCLKWIAHIEMMGKRKWANGRSLVTDVEFDLVKSLVTSASKRSVVFSATHCCVHLPSTKATVWKLFA